MNLSRLIYISTKVPLEPGEIFRIQDEALRNNARDQLTGVLLFNRSYFLQCLEGDREQVTHTFTVIAADPRHTQITLLDVSDIEERTYPNWSMGLLDGTSPAVQTALADVLPGSLFMPANVSSSSAVVLMRRLSTLQLTR